MVWLPKRNPWRGTPRPEDLGGAGKTIASSVMRMPGAASVSFRYHENEIVEANPAGIFVYSETVTSVPPGGFVLLLAQMRETAELSGTFWQRRVR